MKLFAGNLANSFRSTEKRALSLEASFPIEQARLLPGEFGDFGAEFEYLGSYVDARNTDAGENADDEQHQQGCSGRCPARY